MLQIDLEELNRMERPSRVFSSRHHLSIPPVLTGRSGFKNLNKCYYFKPIYICLYLIMFSN